MDRKKRTLRKKRLTGIGVWKSASDAWPPKNSDCVGLGLSAAARLTGHRSSGMDFREGKNERTK